MRPTTKGWAVALGAGGVVAAVVVYSLTTDVVWAVVPLLLTVAAVRRVLQRGAADPAPAGGIHTSR